MARKKTKSPKRRNRPILAPPARELAAAKRPQDLQQAVGESDGAVAPRTLNRKRQPPVAEIPWGHNIALLEKLKDPATRLWYAQQTIANGWSRSMLVYRIDLLFYHLRLRCFVVIDLKTRAFKPEDAGKMNFYLSTIDDQMRHRDDQPSIGLILCKTRSKVIAEYALRDLAKPVGVARYVTRLVESLPEQFRGSLPTIEQLESELNPQPSLKQSKPTRRIP